MTGEAIKVFSGEVKVSSTFSKVAGFGTESQGLKR